MKPILFNTEMVRKILNGRKSVTRRVVKLKYSNTHLEMRTDKYGTRLVEMQNEEPGVTVIQNPDGSTTRHLLAVEDKVPPYSPRNILYVRETWAMMSDWADIDPDLGESDEYIYRADWEDGVEHPRWRPSIHMPKEAARLFLRVTDVRAERLQSILERGPRGAWAEGFVNDIDLEAGTGASATKHFSICWDSTIKKADLPIYGWEANPWTWVIEFERISKEEVFANA